MKSHERLREQALEEFERSITRTIGGLLTDAQACLNHMDFSDETVPLFAAHSIWDDAAAENLKLAEILDRMLCVAMKAIEQEDSSE